MTDDNRLTADAVKAEAAYKLAHAEALVGLENIRDEDVRRAKALLLCRAEYEAHIALLAEWRQQQDDTNERWVASHEAYHGRWAKLGEYAS